MGRVAITGIGLCVAGHNNVNTLFDALAAGQSVIRYDKRMEALGIQNLPSGSLADDQVEWLNRHYPQVEGDSTSVAGKMLFHSAQQALQQAGLEGMRFTGKHAMFIGINKNLVSVQQLHSMLNRYDFEACALSPQPAGSRQQLLELLRPDQVVAPLLRHWNFESQVQVHGDACTAGAAAVVSGYRRIVAGEINAAICGAAEQGSQPIMQMMFAQLGALCQKPFAKAEQASRAFDKDRAGCILADGSAVLILENADKARARGANILAYVAGVSRQSEAFRLTSSAPDGKYYADCMQAAVQDAGLACEDISHINAHGTSTVSNDEAEGRAIHTVFNTTPSVTSTKSALGHSLAASGAIELALSTLSLQRQRVLPSLNFTGPRAGEPALNMVRESAAQPLNYILSNSFGFGGENSSIVLAREVD